MQGKNVNVIVYGGSNTAGGGLEEDEKSIKGRFPVFLQAWWDSVITPAIGSRLKMKTVGIGGTSSSYYQFCYKVYLDDKNTDLAILDASANDAVAITLKNTSNVNRSLPLEQFLRQLLNEPNNPAVMFVNFYLTIREHLGCFNLMDLGQSLLSNHYNITTFNLRNLACDFKSGKFRITTKTNAQQAKDRYHMSLLGHAQTTYMIIEVIRKSIRRLLNAKKNTHDCTIASSAPKYEPLPPPIYIQPSNIIKNPLCWSGLTPHKKFMIKNSLNVSVLKSQGFSRSDSHVPIKNPKHMGRIYRSDCFSCWCGEKKGAEITFSFVVPTTKHSSVSLITRSNHYSGGLEVWLDKQQNKSVKISIKHRNRQTVVVAVAEGVRPGNHTLTIRITRKGNVPIVGIATGG